MGIEKIRRICPIYEDQIVKIKPSRVGVPDKLFWMGTRDGEYTTKSGYNFVMTRDEGPEPMEINIDWNPRVWNLPTTPKVKMLVWKALKRALPVGSRLVERHINVQPICKRCGYDESILCLFFQCSFAHEVWPLAPATSTIDYSGGIDFPDHWNAVRETVPPCGIT